MTRPSLLQGAVFLAAVAFTCVTGKPQGFLPDVGGEIPVNYDQGSSYQGQQQQVFPYSSQEGSVSAFPATSNSYEQPSVQNVEQVADQQAGYQYIPTGYSQGNVQAMPEGYQPLPEGYQQLPQGYQQMTQGYQPLQQVFPDQSQVYPAETQNFVQGGYDFNPLDMNAYPIGANQFPMQHSQDPYQMNSLPQYSYAEAQQAMPTQAAPPQGFVRLPDDLQQRKAMSGGSGNGTFSLINIS